MPSNNFYVEELWVTRFLFLIFFFITKILK